MTRTARVLIALIVILSGVAGFGTATSIVQRHRQMDTCAATYRTQFVPQPDGRPVWTSDACCTLSLDDKVTVHGRVIVAYQADTERAQAAAKASATASTEASTGASAGPDASRTTASVSHTRGTN